jgi:SAM-dependent methyltransferase
MLLAALRIRSDPIDFCRRTSRGVTHYLSGRGVRLDGARALDAGTGGGCVPEALREAGASLVGLDVADHRLRGVLRTPFVLGRGESLPFHDHTFDLVVSSNVLEHVPDTRSMLAELARVCRPGGHVYLSWTTWLSPLGGHEMSPFHYLGPRFAVRAYRATRGRPPMNLPGRNLFAVSVGSVLRELRGIPLSIRDLAPRYWPSLRAIGRIPGVREVALWNCVILLERR